MATTTTNMAGKIISVTLKSFIVLIILTITCTAILGPSRKEQIEEAKYVNLSVLMNKPTKRQIQMTIDTSHSRNFKYFVIAALMLLAGDVNPNPGPVKYPCSCVRNQWQKTTEHFNVINVTVGCT